MSGGVKLFPAGTGHRTDLGFLRRRSRRQLVVPPATEEHRAPAHPTGPTPSAPVASLLALEAPSLEAPLPPAPARPVAAPRSPDAPSVSPAPRRRPQALAPLPDGLALLAPGERRLLTPAAPVVMANRVQSGVGALGLEVLAPPTGRLVVAFALDGTQGVVVGPGPAHGPGTARPLVSVQGLSATLDLAQVRTLSRFVVLLRDPPPGGALLVVTMGSSRLEVALEPGAQGGTWVALTGHVVRGALVLRAEHELLDGGLREATAAHGYDQLVWHGSDSLLNSSTQPEGRTPWQ